MKKAKVQPLKIKLDKIFSEFIRRRDARWLHKNKGTDINFAQCCTCGIVKKWKEMDCGHFIKRRHNTTRYDEHNCTVQCKTCNGGDKEADYALFIIREYGQGTLKRLAELGNQTKQFKAWELLELIETYKQKLKELKQN